MEKCINVSMIGQDDQDNTRSEFRLENILLADLSPPDKLRFN